MAYWLHIKKIDKQLVGFLCRVKYVPLIRFFFSIAHVREVFKWVVVCLFIFEVLSYYLISALGQIQLIRLAKSWRIRSTGVLKMDAIDRRILLRMNAIGCQISFHNTWLIRYTARLVGAVIITQGAGVWRWLCTVIITQGTGVRHWLLKVWRSGTIKWWRSLRVKILAAVRHACWQCWGVLFVRVKTALFLVLAKSLGLTQKGGLEGQQSLDRVVILLGRCRDSHHLVPYLLPFFKRTNKIGHLCRLGWWRHKDSGLRGYALVGKRKLVGDVDNVVSYTVPHNSTNVLRRGLSSLSIVKGVRLIGEKAKGHACRHLKTMRESINPVFHAWVVIERIAVKVAKFRGVPL